MRVAVHRASDTVSTELGVDGQSGFPGHGSDGVRQIADRVPGASGGDRGVERALVSRISSMLVARGTHDEADRRVGDPAVDGGGEVETEQIPVPQSVAVRLAVQDRVVDPGAQHVPERSSTEEGA